MTIPNQISEETDLHNDEADTKGDQPRLHREDVARDKPIRYWSGLYRRPSAWKTPEFSSPEASTNGTRRDTADDDPVSHGVKLGYRVVEENIRQGRRIAQTINDKSSAVEKGENEIGELFARILRYSTDLGALWSDLLNSLAANPEFVNNFLRLFTSFSSSSVNGQRSSPERPGASLAVSVEIVARCPSQVTVDLRPPAAGCELATSGLYAVDLSIPPLLDIQFSLSPGDGPVTLRIHIPDGQPPAVYTGVIVDKKTNLPQGALSVRVASA